jgi:hypothetical protein
MIQLTGMIFEGVPRSIHALRIGFMEGGCSWLPFWMDRMDEEWKKRGEVEAPLCTKKPSDYLRSGQLYFAAEAARAPFPRSSAGSATISSSTPPMSPLGPRLPGQSPRDGVARRSEPGEPAEDPRR